MKTPKRMLRMSIEWFEESWAPKFSFARFAVPVPRLSPLPQAPMSHRCYSLSLRQSPLFTSRGARGFTLIELLVVIGIIAILAGILLPVIAGVKDKAKAGTARSEMASLASAINAYEAEYSRPPASPAAETAAVAAGDITYGTIDPRGNVLQDRDDNNLPIIRTTSFNGDNRIVMWVIMNNTNGIPANPYAANPNVNGVRNPRRHVTFSPKQSRGAGVPGVDANGIMRDPWGNPYIITIDMNEDNRCRDGYYSPRPQDEISGPVAIWSLGKDGQVETPNNPPNPPVHTGKNKDNVLSWR